MNSSPSPESGAEQPSPPHGWYPDPVAPERLRLWDGSGWTDHVRASDDTHSGGPLSFVRPESPAPYGGLSPDGGQTTPATPVPPASAPTSSYGTPVDFRGHGLAGRDPATRVLSNPRGATGGLTADEVPLASWGQRVAATLVDWLINLVLVAVILSVAVKDFWGRYTDESQVWADQVLAGQTDVLRMTPELVHLGSIMMTVAGGVSLLYGVVLLGLRGATFGQQLLKLKVVPFGRGRAKLGWLQAVVRTVVWTLFAQGGSFLLLIQLVSVLLPLWHPHKQTLVDMIARTQVVQVADVKAPGPVDH